MKKNAIISDCGMYRYALWRIWDDAQPLVLFIGLNPSTADATLDDPTLKRCVGFAHQWGYGGISLGNLFAFRSTDPQQLWVAKDPIGPDNDKWLFKLNNKAALAVAAWGDDGVFKNRNNVVLRLFPNLFCIKMSRQGNPRHPLYLPRTLKPSRIIDSSTTL